MCISLYLVSIYLLPFSSVFSSKNDMAAVFNINVNLQNCHYADTLIVGFEKKDQSNNIVKQEL